MAAWLVSSRVQAKVQQERSLVLWRIHVGCAERIWKVVSVERAGVLGKDLNSVSLQLQGINGLSLSGEHHGVSGINTLVGQPTGSVNCICGRLPCSGSNRVAIQGIVRQQGQSVPVAVLVRIGSCNVSSRAQTNVHGLNGPFQLGQQHVVSLLSHAHALEAMNADQTEATIIPVLMISI
jgi:hypothetical protein